jgi:hypothetical protein
MTLIFSLANSSIAIRERLLLVQEDDCPVTVALRLMRLRAKFTMRYLSSPK